MQKISIVFIGTGEFGCTTLNALTKDERFDIPLVITGKESPIKAAALANKLFIQEVEKAEDAEKNIIQAGPAFILLVSFGEIIPVHILKLAKIASINIHASLLPKYRGASPVQTAIINGDKVTGISWILMSKKVDHGDIVAQEKVQISENEGYISLSGRLSNLSSSKTADVLLNYLKNPISNKQDESSASYCKRIVKKDGLIKSIEETAEQILRKIKAYQGWPGTWLLLNGKRLKVFEAEIVDQKISSGEIVANKKSLLIGTVSKALSLRSVQPEGKRIMHIEEYLRGQR